MNRHEPTHQVPGRDILSEVRNAYRGAYSEQISAQGTRVVTVRFDPSPGAPSQWAARMRGAQISADRKHSIFAALGAEPVTVVLPDTAQNRDLRQIVADANDDPRVAGIIVQSPPPRRLAAALDDIDPDKDLDALGVDSPRAACATADGIVRIAAPFLTAATTVAVVGSRGFVGTGVSTLLRAAGHAPLELDVGDDLRGVRDADVVLSTTGTADVLTTEHIRPEHILVVDSGFVPHAAGPRGDVAPDAALIPRAITPVPGGIGPVEMAVLAERLVQHQTAPGLRAWRYHGPGQGPATLLTSAAADVAHHQLDNDARTAARRASRTYDAPDRPAPRSPPQQPGRPAPRQQSPKRPGPRQSR